MKKNPVGIAFDASYRNLLKTGARRPGRCITAYWHRNSIESLSLSKLALDWSLAWGDIREEAGHLYVTESGLEKLRELDHKLSIVQRPS